MSHSRSYWEPDSKKNNKLSRYKGIRIKPYCLLDISCSRLGFKKNIIYRYISIYFNKDWLACLNSFDIVVYYKFINMVNKFVSTFNNMPINTNLVNIFDLSNSHLFFSIDYRHQKCDSYNWLNKGFIIHFIRLQKRYNKRRYLRVRVVSRPSFWAGSLLSCICISMFWGASFHLVDWVFVQALIIDVNFIIAVLYFVIICRYYFIVLDCYTKSIRLRWKRTYSKYLVVYQRVLTRIKWFK